MFEIIKEHILKADLKRFDESNNALEASFIIEVVSFKGIHNFKFDLQNEFNNITVSLIDNNIIV